MSEGMLDALSAVLRGPVFAVDGEGRVRDANGEACSLLGARREELLGRPLASFVADGPEALDAQLRAWRRSRETLRGALSWRCADGRIVRTACEGGATPDGVALIRCGERLVPEQGFAAPSGPREWLGVVLRSIADAVIATDAEARVVFMNPAAERLTGWSAEEASGRPIGEVFDIRGAETREPVESPAVRALRGDAAAESAGRAALRRRDGTELPIEAGGAAVRREGGDVGGAVLVFRGVTECAAELAATHERLRATERMASLGTLSAGLGHDIGNLLMPMNARLRALGRLDLPPGAAEHLAVIAECTEYLRKLTGGLRLLAQDPNRRTPGERTPLASWWGEIEPLLRNVLPRSAQLRCLPLDPDLSVGMSRPALTQAVFNIVQNAGEVLRGRADGAVEIEATRGEGGSVVLRISDNGPGMPEDVRHRCLEPFFTTKPREFATGLGLALVHGVVGSVGGRVEIESEPQRGTCFRLTLPSGDRREEPRPAAEPVALVSVQDARLRALTRAALAPLGWRVREEEPAGSDADARLWITWREPPPEALSDFLRGGAERRVVVVGADAPRAKAAHAAAEPDGGGVAVRAAPGGTVLRLGTDMATSELRRRLREAAGAAAGGGPDGAP